MTSREREREKAYIFDQEYCLPTDLRSQVLHYQFASVTNTGGGQGGIIVEYLGFALERELLSFDIKLSKHVPYVRRKDACKAQLDRTRGSFAARAALTSATVATSSDLLIVSEIGKSWKRGDLPVAAMVSEIIVRAS